MYSKNRSVDLQVNVRYLLQKKYICLKPDYLTETIEQGSISVVLGKDRLVTRGTGSVIPAGDPPASQDHRGCETRLQV
jgi:hypothetical protein